MLKKKTFIYSSYIFILVILIIVFRFILTGAIPLLDKTEARYAEIARLMYETKEWVVLQIEYGVPFWAKPPLSTWLTASSFEAFGVNEISARLPSFLICLFILIILGKLVKKSGSNFYLPAFILLTTPEFLIHSGVVSTDTALCFSIVLIMISFWKSIQNDKNTLWNYLFFLGIGLGLLSKGPLVLVLTVPPIFIWLILQKVKIKEVYSRLPWITGTLITVLIAVPWYWLAEKRSPGFFDYFIIGEHFNRFFVSGWEGDLYGSGHSQPLGMIWLFLMAFAFPWIQIVFLKLWTDRKSIFKDKWVSYLILWLFWTPLFFTLSKNILHTYILPTTIPVALLIIHWWEHYERKKLALILSSIFPFVTLIAFVGLSFNPEWNTYLNSDKYILENPAINVNNSITPVYYWNQQTYSSEFYSKGKMQKLNTIKELDSISHIYDTFFLISLNKRKKDIPKEYKERMKPLDSNYKSTLYIIEKTY